LERVELLSSVGSYYCYQKSQPKEAKRLLEQALLIKEEHYGKDHVELAATLANLGCAYTELGETKQARELFERALSMLTKNYHEEHPHIIFVRRQLKNLETTKNSSCLVM
jgi:Tfp pilus assembly protein PilF